MLSSQLLNYTGVFSAFHQVQKQKFILRVILVQFIYHTDGSWIKQLKLKCLQRTRLFVKLP